VNSICSSYLAHAVASCIGHFVGDQHIARSSGVCTYCGDVAAAVAAVECSTLRQQDDWLMFSMNNNIIR